MRRNAIWVGALVGLLIALTFRPAPAQSPGEDMRELREELLDATELLVEQIEERYVEEVDYDKLLVGAYQGMLSKLDRHSIYMPAGMLKEFRQEIEGEFGGLGVKIRFNSAKKAVEIEQVLPRTPAAQNGLLPGDLIVEVREGDEVIRTADFDDVHDAVKVLRGKVGTKVTITVLRADSGERKEITITRAKLTEHSVDFVKLMGPDQKIGYIKLSYFNKKAAEDLEDAINYLHEKGMEGLILDLRFNPGGLLEAARDCAGLFLHDKRIVSTKDRDDAETILYARGGRQYQDLPLVVLVNHYSASGAEIVSAALQDHQRAKLVGEPTYGKASVQKVIDNPHDKSGIKLTIAYYYTPNKELIEGKGVKPDDEVKLSDDDTRRLLRHLARQVQYEPIPREDEEPEQVELKDEGGSGTDETAEEEFADLQLERALEVLVQALAEGRLKTKTAVAETAAVPGG